ncbi:ATP-dependent protease [Lacimicrobium alkaliphilum]|uniref:ATP-dependent protease n=2 Tax=Lacimicrobium alkaliphilum TaxID=1526571 RepID=A0ABQ1RFB1_9ALTE|nr:ATP-dependent protease [Lacimicrobium alkaliphilum]
MSLRIFEPRYLRMVKEACAGNLAFGICMINPHGDKDSNQHIYPMGTHVRVTDFDMLDDGLLGITVEGLDYFWIDSISTDPDGLRVGQCRWLEAWQYDVPVESIVPMKQKLKQIFDQFPDVRNLYQQPHFEDPLWVMFRWLELVPVEASLKQELLHQKDCRKVLNFLTQLVN